MQHFQTHVGLLGKAYGGVGFEGFAAVIGDEATDQADDAALVRHFVFLPFAQALEEVGAVSFLHAVEHFFFFRLPVGGFFAVIGGNTEIAADDVGVVLIELEYQVGFVGHAPVSNNILPIKIPARRKHHGPAGDQGAGIHKTVGAVAPAFLNVFPSIHPTVPCIEQYHHTPAVVFYPRAAVAADSGQTQLVAAAAIRLFGPVGSVDDGRTACGPGGDGGGKEECRDEGEAAGHEVSFHLRRAVSAFQTACVC